MYKLSPSKAHRFLNCTASLQYDGEFKETPVTIRGNILHKYGEMRLKNKDTREFEERHEINEYEQFLIRTYSQAVWAEYNKIGATRLFVEEKMPMRIYWFKINYIIDALISAGRTASIIDLKSGNGDVDAEYNEQLLMYGYGILSKAPSIKKLRLSIFQKGKMKTSIVTQDEVMDFFLSKYDVFEQIYNNELTFNPSEKACRFCGAKDTCLARAKWIVGGKTGDTKV